MPLMTLKAIWSKVWCYVAVAGVVLAGLFAVRQSGKVAGRYEAERRQDKETIKGMEAAKDARAEIDALDDAAVRDRARQRMRNRAR